MVNFTQLNNGFSNQLEINQKSYLYFAGTAYLGLPKCSDFINLFIKGIEIYGLNNGTSRINNIQLGIYNEAESVAANRFAAEDALISSSGYLAAQLTVKSLKDKGQVIYAPSTHPAIWIDNAPGVQGSFNEWATKTIDYINSSAENNWVIISNSMNNLFPEVYDFSFLLKIRDENNILLIVDDSHGIGVLNNGKGAFAMLPKKQGLEVVVVASMAKALGVDAGIVLGSKKIINSLKQSNEFVGASPGPAASLYAFIHAENIYQNQLDKLNNNMENFASKVGNQFKYDVQFPVYLSENVNFYQDLLAHKILISSFPYPNANSAPLNRIVISSWHTTSDLNILAESI